MFPSTLLLTGCAGTISYSKYRNCPFQRRFNPDNLDKIKRNLPYKVAERLVLKGDFTFLKVSLASQIFCIHLDPNPNHSRDL